MTDRSVVSSRATFRGPRNNIETGNGPVSSSPYENATVAPGIISKHICLADTANTVSIGALNEDSSVGFSWLPPLSRSAGPAFGFKAISSSSDPSFNSLGRSDRSPLRPGAMHYEGAFQFFPCRQSSRTPEAP